MRMPLDTKHPSKHSCGSSPSVHGTSTSWVTLVPQQGNVCCHSTKIARATWLLRKLSGWPLNATYPNPNWAKGDKPKKNYSPWKAVVVVWNNVYGSKSIHMKTRTQDSLLEHCTVAMIEWFPSYYFFRNLRFDTFNVDILFWSIDQLWMRGRNWGWAMHGADRWSVHTWV